MIFDMENKDGTDAAVSFLDKMFSEGFRHLVAILPNGSVEARSFGQGEVDETARWINSHQGEANLYFHVNGFRPGIKNKKATKGDILEALFLHVDIDNLHGLECLQSFTPAPTVIVFSGGGYHAYWKLATGSVELERVEQINIAIAQQVGGDKCHNIDRIMRLPGTINLPNQRKQVSGRVPTLASVITADWMRNYSLDDFSLVSGSAGPKRTVSTPIAPIFLDTIPRIVLSATRALIEHGDDPDRSRRSEMPRFRSRSEVVFRVACDLTRALFSEEDIAGVLINPAYGISTSILEKKSPKAYALKQAKAAKATVENGWPDVDRLGAPKATMRNAITALQRLELAFSHDLFRHRKIINGALLEDHAGEISDDACSMLRALVIDRFHFDPRAENVRDAVTQLCLENTFHPIREMLDEQVWDGVPRLDSWLTTYLGAEDSDLNAAIGPIILIAAVRRVREPGAKFDTIPIFEGRQGTGKSTALQILAGAGNHSDNEILTLDTKAQMEAMEGVWIYELSEISGLRKAEIERTKAFASRQIDRARMSYGRFSESRGRQTIFIGTTNDDQYLRDRTGYRRFLPVRTGNIDLPSLRRDRDLLWAEATRREALGESIALPPELWEAAAAEQEKRLEDDPWLEKLANTSGTEFDEEARVFTHELLTDILGVELERQNNGHTKRLSGLMRTLGWEPGKFKVAGKTLRGFRRPKNDEHVDDPDAIAKKRIF